MLPDWPVPRFDALSTTLVALLVAGLLVVGPALGRRRGRTRFYVEALVEQWVAAGVALVVVGTAAGVGREHLGLVGSRPGAGWWTVYAAALSLAVLGAGLVLRRRLARGDAVRRPLPLDSVLPRTPAERRLAAAVAVSSGVCEEIVHRGLLVAAGVGILGLNPLVAALVALAVFVATHAWQGAQGMLFATVLGFACTGFYLWTGSLLPAVLLHVATNTRTLLLLPPADDTDPPAAAPLVIRSRRRRR